MRSRTWPVLIFALGTLVILIGLAGLGAYRRARQIQSEIEAIHEFDRKSTSILNRIHSGIHLSGIFLRDYLLDPSHLTAAMHRERLLEIRSSMTTQLDELDRLIGREDAGALQLLRREIDAYWDSMDAIFEWTPQQKMTFSSVFLAQQVLPRRDAVLALAGGIQKLNESTYERQQAKLEGRQAQFRRYLWWMMGITLSLGLLVAIGTSIQVSRLEKRDEEQQRRTERAEQELRGLSQQLVQAQEAERKSLSRELHDQVGQMLTAMRMELGNLEGLRSAPGEQFRVRLEEVKRLAEQTMAAVRDLATGLRPAMLDDLGLAPALEWQGRDFSRRSGIPVTVQIDGFLDGLPDSHRTCVFRVVQEALTNCARHAQARNIRVAVHGSPDALSVMIQDDGVGIDGAESAIRGLGLVGIEERVRELGGTVTIFSQPKRGTSLKVEIPVQRPVAL